MSCGKINVMRMIRTPLILIFILLVSACSLAPGVDTSVKPMPVSDLLTGDQNLYTATPTPFQPAFSGSSIAPIQSPTPFVTATPEKVGMISLGLDRPKSQVNILVMGSDWRPGQGYRTDVMMILSIIPELERVSLLSFPRDLYINIPGDGYERINTTQAKGGFTLTAETFLLNFDAPVDYYIMTNFTGFESIVDTLGGINVYAEYELYDRCDLPQAYAKMCYIPPGLNTMNGETALWYVRSRYSTSDFDRTRRAQEVMIALTKKIISLNAVNRAPELFDLFRNSVETDIPLDLVVRLLPLAATSIENPSTIYRYAITEGEVTHYVVPDTGAMVMIPDYLTISKTIKNALYPSLEQ